ncbi:MAG TPA: GYD domain-containing protein [Candidatus Acidoferrales bacterium]|jgi:uncharacterized protein with GYD domain|nr:GYD domain-containing protein [Candidatus Acidoferrales bacterium]
MPSYLQQVSYTQEAWSALVSNPQNRIEAVRPAIEKLGGKIINAYFSFGEYDVITITEFQNIVDAAAIAMAFAAGGAVRAVKTTPLLTTNEALEALKKASTSGYKAVAAGR